MLIFCCDVYFLFVFDIQQRDEVCRNTQCNVGTQVQKIYRHFPRKYGICVRRRYTRRHTNAWNRYIVLVFSDGPRERCSVTIHKLQFYVDTSFESAHANT